MSKNPYVNFAGRVVPQSEPTSPKQVKNNAGGYVFKTSDKTRIERFLMLGTMGGTYYQSEKELTQQNADDLVKIILADPRMVIDVVRDVAINRRALRPSPAIFVTALMFVNFKHVAGVGAEKTAAYRRLHDLVPVVCKTSTQMFELCEYFKKLGGWSRARRRAIADWYEDFSPDALAYQMIKYRQRNGWTHADALRLSHAIVDPALAQFAKCFYNPEKNVISENLSILSDAKSNLLALFEEAQAATKPKDYLRIVKLGRLPWEAFPTSVHKDVNFWKELFYAGQLRNQALVRNITRIAKLNGFQDIKFARAYADKLVTEATGLHPLNFLNAFVVYTEGQEDRSAWYRQKNWTTEAVIKDALQEGFYAAFERVVPSGKRIFLALDVSSSMSSMASGLDISCAQLCGVMAMSIARTEKNYLIRGFAGSTNLAELGISANTDLSTAMSNVHKSNFGTTDCSLPMLWAAKNRIEIDTFVVLTDNETWAGKVHPHKALEDYRQQIGINAGQIVVAATATPFSIANPNDPKTLDVVGGDSNLPKIVSEFC